MAKRSSRKSAAVTLDASTRICVLCGTEQMIKQQYFEQLRGALEAEHGEIDPILIDGATTELAAVFDEVRTFSMLQSYKLVVVDEADQFVKRFREPMERYASEPVDTATLVLRSTRWNKGNLDKKIAKIGAVVKCDVLKTGEAIQWLMSRAKSHHARTINRPAAELLIERMGTQLLKLDSELGKLALMVDEKQTIDASLISQATGRASDEQAWVVQEAMLDAIANAPQAGRGGTGGTRAAGPMIAKVRELVEIARQPEVVVMWAVVDLCRKFHLAWMMRGQGASDFDIGKELKLFPPPRRQAFIGAMKRIDAAAAGQLFDKAIDYDGRGKSGFGPPLRNLECMCTLIASQVR